MRTLEELAGYLEQELKLSLQAQGHVATKRLLNSIKVVVERSPQGQAIVGTHLYYGKYTDSGVGPRRAWADLDSLVEWIRAKPIPLKGMRELDVAKRIRWAIWQKGIPTDGDPAKLRFVRRVLDENEQVVQTTINAFFQATVASTLRNNVENATRILA